MERCCFRFRVYAENIVGLSPPLTGEPVTVKDPFNPPGAPSTPEITGYDTNMVALKWNPPREDGGSKIEQYGESPLQARAALRPSF